MLIIIVSFFLEDEYKHIMWNDEDIRNYIETNFLWFLPIFDNYKHNICRIDIARYFILFGMGGIYCDMDFYCYQNFYNLLPKNIVSLVESPYKNNEIHQNSLMTSPQYNKFWLDIFRQSLKSRNFDNKDIDKKIHALHITGPNFLDNTVKNSKIRINKLPLENFNPNAKIDHQTAEIYLNDTFVNNVYTRHLHTAVWLK